MKKSCSLAAELLVHVGRFVKPGVTTNELDQISADYIQSHGAVASPLNYHGFPKSICTSVNEVVCHGVPGAEALKDGDIINLDVTVYLGGFHGDTSATFPVGRVSERASRIIDVAREARDRGILAIEKGAKTGDIGFAVDKYVTRQGYTTVKEIGGHGIGRGFHEDPFVPAFGKRGKGDILVPWCCLTVEPMVNEGTDQVMEHSIRGSDIKWYTTRDKKLSAQFEHTVLITDSGYEILTLS